MSTVRVANIDFESTANNQLAYTSANTITVRAGGNNVMVVNTSGAFISVPVVDSGYAVVITSANVFVNSYIIGIDTTSYNSLNASGKIVINGIVSPSAISSNTSSWNPPIANNTIVRFSGDSSNTSTLSIYGMKIPANDGTVIILSNIGTKAVTLASEDSNQTVGGPPYFTGTRFSLPQSITLNGYQSISLFYDATANRWKLSESNNVLPYYKKLLTKGFFAGGQGGPLSAAQATADRTTYSTETTAAVPGANLSSARRLLAGSGNACKGFFAGGIGPAPLCASSCAAYRTLYSTEATSAVTGANLSQARNQLASAGNFCKLFFSGGCGVSPIVEVATSNRTTYSSETTAAITGANLSQARKGSVAAGNSCKGFFSGGCGVFPIAIIATADRTTYSTETTAAVPGANLSQARYRSGAAGNDCKGFFAGGSTTGACVITVASTADVTTYSTETTAAVPGANLSQARSGPAGTGNLCKGFFSGGQTPTNVATADRTTYSSETTAAVPGANLSQARSGAGAI